MKHTARKAKSAESSRNLAAAMEHAVALHQRGELDEARRRYRAILSARPDEFAVLHCLGALELQQGHAAEACRLISRAVKVNPASPEAHLNLGNALKALNKQEAALTSYERALAIKVDYAEAHNNRGNVLLDLKRYGEALASYDKALAPAPNYVDAHFNRGVVLHDLERHEEALASYDRALAIDSTHAGALSNRGNVLQDLKRHAEALASYDKALTIAPNLAEVHNNRGNALRRLRRYEEALASYEQAAAINPGYAEVYYNRGMLFYELKHHAKALADYSRALTLAPDHVSALYMRGIVLDQQNRHEEAIRDFAHVLKLNPPDPKFADTAGSRLYSKLRICDWQGYEEETARVIAGIRAGHRSIPPFSFLAISDSAQDQLSCSQIWTRSEFPTAETPVWLGERYDHGRIRIAYLSADLRDHAVAYLMAGLFDQHDRAKFETTAVSFGSDTPSDMRSRLRRAFEHFIEVGHESDHEIAQLLRQREIDIAVDLNGYTLANRTGIFALRPVPVQVNYLGYPGTLGADYFDYILADRYTIPAGRERYYSEKAVYLPETFQANDRKRRIAERSMTRAEAGLPESGFVFCCFNKNYKITPAVFAAWTRLLDKVGSSVLWLIHGHALVESNLRREAGARGIDQARLIFAPKLRYEEHLARYRLADLFLDTLPFNAGTTASDALWEGLPVLTCMGDAFAARMAASLLHAIGLPELITRSLDEYEALAFSFATDPKMLAGIKTKLARNRETHPLFDTDRFRRHIEQAYLTMWERWQRGEAPASFAVEPILP